MKSPIILAIILAVALMGGAAYTFLQQGKNPIIVNPIGGNTANGVKQFSSEEDFISYLSASSHASGMGYLGSSFSRSATMNTAAPTSGALPSESTKGASQQSEDASRVSTTNVQVAGIDEPDIVKTDGREIYLSSQGLYYVMKGGVATGGDVATGFAEMPAYYGPVTKLIAAYPPSGMKEDSNITVTGNLLVHGSTLIVFSYSEIYGYDVSNPSSPVEKWKMELNGSMVGARLIGDKLYLVTQNYIDQYNPCPIIPLTRNGVAVSIACPMIYHPISYVSTDATYNTIEINPDSGNVDKAVSFVGTSGYSIVYMSSDAIYVTYSYYEDYFKTFTGFISEKMGDLLPATVIDKLNKLNTYDISDQAKLTEITVIFDNYQNSLSPDDRLKFQNEMNNRMNDYVSEHKREMQGTGIIKIGLDLNVVGTGSVPGTTLNQFSLDEYNGNLRVATTIGDWSNSTNDIYILDGSMKLVGSLLDLGQGESIYSVRFIQDKGYLVTFKQTDPFFVLDLSDPSNPQVKGELKIPGYSSYLHPIGGDKILGIGMEKSNVKISLFDVSSPENPVEIDHYSLNEYWSDAMNTHHAFLLDEQHQIFFVPGGNGGYVFSYENNQLVLKKAVADIDSQRALYINDYLYVVGSNKIVVLDENSWETVKEIAI